MIYISRKKMKKITLFIVTVALALTGCTSTKQAIVTAKPMQRAYFAPTPSKQPLFQKTMIAVAKSTLKDSRYKKMALDTPAKKLWFKTLMYRLWDRQMTRNEFITEGLKRYPTKRYEFTFVSNGFQSRS
jgi:PBP1b-binding outer membrane lipoprotein LpoB